MRRLLVIPLALAAIVTASCSMSYGTDPATVQAGTRDVNLPLPGGKGGDQVVGVVQAVLPAVVNVTTDQFQPEGGDGQGIAIDIASASPGAGWHFARPG